MIISFSDRVGSMHGLSVPCMDHGTISNCQIIMVGLTQARPNEVKYAISQ